MIVPSTVRDQLIAIVGNLTGEEIVTNVDDGMTQTVTARAGLALKDRVALPSPVILAPYRTFREIEQPASAFVLRARKGDGGPSLALYEADGGMWKHDAMVATAVYLRQHLDISRLVLA